MGFSQSVVVHEIQFFSFLDCVQIGGSLFLTLVSVVSIPVVYFMYNFFIFNLVKKTQLANLELESFWTKF
jgi:hypothetical protein